MPKETILRDYQLEMLDRLHLAWEQHQSVMVQMPAGTGKTHLMAEVIRGEFKINKFKNHNSSSIASGGVLVVAHRRELIGQISHTLERFGIEHGLIVSGKRIDGTKPVQVASIQTLSRRLDNLDSNGAAKNNFSLLSFHFSLIIIDEAHHAVAKSYRWLWERWPQARFLGVTATPCRLDGSGLTDLFDTLLQSWTTQEFINKGWLSDFEYVSAAPDNKMVKQVRELKKRGVGGDYQEKEMCAVLDVPESIEHLYKTYQAFACGKKGIVYAIDRTHARHIAEHYSSIGVSCAVIDSKTPEKERKLIVEEYRQQSIDVLVNIDIFGEGFDVPEVEFIQLARPTLSLSKYLQQVGRGMRISERKEAVLILDQVGLYQTFGLPTDDYDWRCMFEGRLAGKGSQTDTRGIVIRDDADNKMLVNLEMVRIKHRGEAHKGLEIFLKDGRYGIMKDGRVTCLPELERVTRLEAPYFAMGTYPYYVFRNRMALMDMQGCDMRPELYGKGRKEGDVFIGNTASGTTVYWDAKGGRQYRSMPTFGHIRNFEVAMVGDKLYMREKTSQWESPVVTQRVYLHSDYVIFGDRLVFYKDRKTIHRVRGYDRNGIYIECNLWCDPSVKYACLSRDGSIRQYTKALPGKLNSTPVNPSDMNLRRFQNTIKSSSD